MLFRQRKNTVDGNLQTFSVLLSLHSSFIIFLLIALDRWQQIILMHKFPRIKFVSKLMLRNYSTRIIFHADSVGRSSCGKESWFLLNVFHLGKYTLLRVQSHWRCLQGFFFLSFYDYFARKEEKNYKWASFVLLLRYDVRIHRALIRNDCFHRDEGGWDCFSWKFSYL